MVTIILNMPVFDEKFESNKIANHPLADYTSTTHIKDPHIKSH